jgi:hypothetical protein
MLRSARTIVAIAIIAAMALSTSFGSASAYQSLTGGTPDQHHAMHSHEADKGQSGHHGEDNPSHHADGSADTGCCAAACHAFMEASTVPLVFPFTFARSYAPSADKVGPRGETQRLERPPRQVS